MKTGYEWRDYIIASVDVLGQRAEFNKIADYLVDEVPQNTLEEVAENTVSVIEYLRQQFKDLYESYCAKSESKVEVPAEHKAEYDAMRASAPIGFQFFSDSMIAHVALRTEKYRMNDVIAINGIFSAIGAQLLITLASGNSFRCGIELGIATKFEDGDIFGPVLREAYDLESKVAKYPRIVIGEKLEKYLDNYSKGLPLVPGQTERDVNGCKTMADVCLRMLDNDKDGRLILDYLGEYFRNRFNFDPSGKVYDMALQFVKAKLKEKSDSGDMEVAAKYEKLLGYFELKLSKS